MLKMMTIIFPYMSGMFSVGILLNYYDNNIPVCITAIFVSIATLAMGIIGMTGLKEKQDGS